ncbi:MAG: thioredoxin, partial [Mailhella sp.]
PNPGAPIGVKAAQRDYTRVLEFDPTTLKIVWQYTPHEAGFVVPLDASRFYSPFISSAQRLPNGNTLITEGSDGRLIEVTADHEIVWEFINPYKDGRNMNMVYRSYRVPYEWVPQAEHTPEVAIAPVDCASFRMPGAAAFGSRSSEVEVEGTLGYVANAGDCIAATDD